MVQVSNQAAERMSELCARTSPDEELSIRIRAVARGGIELEFDYPRPGDRAVTHGNRRVLVLDPASARRLLGRKLDLEPSDAGEVLVIS